MPRLLILELYCLVDAARDKYVDGVDANEYEDDDGEEYDDVVDDRGVDCFPGKRFFVPGKDVAVPFPFLFC